MPARRARRLSAASLSEVASASSSPSDPGDSSEGRVLFDRGLVQRRRFLKVSSPSRWLCDLRLQASNLDLKALELRLAAKAGAAGAGRDTGSQGHSRHGPPSCPDRGRAPRRRQSAAGSGARHAKCARRFWLRPLRRFPDPAASPPNERCGAGCPPPETHEVLHDGAARCSGARLYSTVPRSSQWPSTVTLAPARLQPGRVLAGSDARRRSASTSRGRSGCPRWPALGVGIGRRHGVFPSRPRWRPTHVGSVSGGGIMEAACGSETPGARSARTASCP